MPSTMNRFWLAIGVPAVVAAAIGATAAFAQDDGAPAEESPVLLQQEPTPTPAPENTPEDTPDEDGTTPEKDCPRDGGSGEGDSEESSGSTTGISFRR